MKFITKIWVFFSSLLLSQDHWETAIFADDIWRYNVPDTELASDWNTNSFNDGFWILRQGGYGSFRWNGTNDYNQRVSSGLYLYTIQAGNFRGTKKMVILE